MYILILRQLTMLSNLKWEDKEMPCAIILSNIPGNMPSGNARGTSARFCGSVQRAWI